MQSTEREWLYTLSNTRETGRGWPVALGNPRVVASWPGVAPYENNALVWRTLVRRTGGTRRVAGAVVVPLAVASFAILAGCGNPTQSVRHCVGAPEDIVQAIQQKLTAKGKLRNAKLVHLSGSPNSFISAEIHLDSDDKHDKGDIATWSTTGVDSAEGFQSVDVHAREESAWPQARFTVTKNGALESRACTGLNRGKTRAQIQCEQDQNSGEGVNLPADKDCSDL